MPWQRASWQVAKCLHSRSLRSQCLVTSQGGKDLKPYALSMQLAPPPPVSFLFKEYNSPWQGHFASPVLMKAKMPKTLSAVHMCTGFSMPRGALTTFTFCGKSVVRGKGIAWVHTSSQRCIRGRRPSPFHFTVALSREHCKLKKKRI